MLYEKVRARQRAENKMKKVNSAAISNNNNAEEELNTEEIETTAAFFEKCLLPVDMNAVVDKLSATVDIRKTSLAKDKTILESSFHLYRVCADLVIYIQYMSNRVSKRFYQKFHLLFWQVFMISKYYSTRSIRQPWLRCGQKLM